MIAEDTDAVFIWVVVENCSKEVDRRIFDWLLLEDIISDECDPVMQVIWDVFRSFRNNFGQILDNEFQVGELFG